MKSNHNIMTFGFQPRAFSCGTIAKALRLGNQNAQSTQSGTRGTHSIHTRTHTGTQVVLNGLCPDQRRSVGARS